MARAATQCRDIRPETGEEQPVTAAGVQTARAWRGPREIGELRGPDFADVPLGLGVGARSALERRPLGRAITQVIRETTGLMNRESSRTRSVFAWGLLLAAGVPLGCSSGTLAPDNGASSDGGTSPDGGASPGNGTSPDGGTAPGTGTSPDAASAEGGNTAAPTVLSSAPDKGAVGVPLNASISAVFSEPMDPATLTSTTFTVTSAGGAPVAGTVIYSGTKAVLWPTAQLASGAPYTATITSGARSVSGAPLAADYVWTFTTGSSAVAGVPVDLGTAAEYVILAKSALSTVAPSAVTGDLGLSPAAATYITGFSLIADATNVFSTSSQVTGKIYAADYAAPTPINLTTSIGDMGTAFTAAAGRAPDVTNLGAGAIGGRTLPAGVYRWDTGLLVPTDITLTGSATDVWVFQVAKILTVSDGVKVVLAGGALARNVFWQVSGSVSLGTTVQFEGIILCQTSIALNTGSSITGRMLAQTAVTINASTVVAP
jgi:hypothetical protein